MGEVYILIYDDCKGTSRLNSQLTSQYQIPYYCRFGILDSSYDKKLNKVTWLLRMEDEKTRYTGEIAKNPQMETG